MLRVLLVLSGVYVSPSIPTAAYPSSSKISPVAFATRAVTKSVFFLADFSFFFFTADLYFSEIYNKKRTGLKPFDFG
jgi:hypothetical protein